LSLLDKEDAECCFEIDFTKSYEHYEFLGDKILSLPIVDFVSYLNFRGKHNVHSILGISVFSENRTEGYMTKMCSYLERKDQLAEFSKILKLDKFIIMSCHEEKSSNRKNERFLEDIFEAFIGALYLDQGFEVCHKFIIKLINKHVNIDDIVKNPTNYKDMLLKFFHKQKWNHPIYNCVNGDEINNGNFISIVKIQKNKLDDEKIKFFNQYTKNIYSHYPNYQNKIKECVDEDEVILGIGCGKVKKIAEQECSKVILNHFGVKYTL
jgi:dsRNA-specific ribonuclease